MARRRRNKPLTTPAKPAASAPNRMARVQATDDRLGRLPRAGRTPSIAQVLGALVEREVDRDRARRLKAGQLDDQQLVDALDRARELHENLTALVARLERRLDHQSPAPVDPGR
jgi:hypothetical protein